MYTQYIKSLIELMACLCLQYLGEWYEIEKLPAYFAIGECVQANYSMGEDGTVRVLTSQVLNVL